MSYCLNCGARQPFCIEVCGICGLDVDPAEYGDDTGEDEPDGSHRNYEGDPEEMK